MPVQERPCKFEESAAYRWRRSYAKGSGRSRKQHAWRVSRRSEAEQTANWYEARILSKVRIICVESFLPKPPRLYKTLVEREFLRLSEDWKGATMHWSSITRMTSHPSYLRIIGLATASKEEVLRLLLLELQNEPDHWFAALTAITGHDPVRPEHSFDDAVDAWLNWGHQRGLI